VKIKVTVDSITKGKCSLGHKVGDSWLIEPGFTPDRMCDTFYHAMYGAIKMFQGGGSFSKDPDKDVKLVSCPDPKHMVVFEVKRIP